MFRRPEPSPAPIQYSPQPPQPQPSPTTGRSVFAHPAQPANASYQPNNYDQYYAVYDDDDQLYRDVGKCKATYLVVALITRAFLEKD